MQEAECWSAALRLIEAGDERRAVEICEEHPCSRVPRCQTYLGWYYYRLNRLDKATEWFTKGAETKDGDALFGLGSVNFVLRDFKMARTYYERAALEGCARAYGWLGYIHHQGLGTARDLELAIQHYQKAASHGYLLADRALLHITFQRGTILEKIAAVPRLIAIMIKAFLLAKNPADPRISDIPNAFEKKN